MNSTHESAIADPAELRHGLRTPLNHIIGYAEMLREDALQSGLSDLATRLENLLEEAQHICDVVQMHPIFSKRSITNDDVDELRLHMHDSVQRLQAALAGLPSSIEPSAAADVHRIEKAVSELAAFSESGKRPVSLAAPLQQSSQTVRKEISPPADGYLLVVDDDEANRDVLRRHLERQGYHVEEASSGSEALALLQEKAFDTVLLDLVMPERSGLEILSEIKQNSALRDLPVLVISASDELASVAESLESGAEDYLVKPFDPILLHARLSATLERKRFRDRERMRSKELEQVTKALKQSNEDLKRFAYAASHDLQAPIRTIVSYLQLLERRLAGRLDSDEQELIGFARDAAKRMSTLVQDLLLYSQASTQHRKLGPVNCEALLSELISDLQAVMEESGATVSWSSLPTIQAEWTSMRQLFQNLVGNAIKYRASRPLQVEILARQQDEFWVFCVKDNGIGIAPAYTTRIFEMFQRLHGEELPGSGIGLAICQRIVDRFGGKIWVESDMDIGSRFYFTIPINPSVSGETNEAT